MVFSCRRPWASRSGATSSLAWFHSSTPELSNRQPWMVLEAIWHRRQRSHPRSRSDNEADHASRTSLRARKAPWCAVVKGARNLAQRETQRLVVASLC